jgi:hypothetical protein
MESKLKMVWRGRVAAFFVLGSMALTTAPAWAAPKRKPPAHRPAAHKPPEVESPERVEAQRHYATGVELFGHGEYRSALVEFELVSMELPNKPPLDYQIARCLDSIGNARLATEHYRAFIAHAPADPNVPEARKRIDELAPEVARAEQQARTPEPAPEPRRRRERPIEQVSQQPVSDAPAAEPQHEDDSAPRVTPAREYLLGITQGVSVPVASSAYASDFNTSYVAGLRFAVDFRLADHVQLGPCLEIDGLPLNSSPAQFPVGTANAKLGEVRGVVGAELRLPTRYIELWVRAMVGVDAIVGSIKDTAATKVVTHAHVSSTVLGFVPQVGWSVPVSSRVNLGLGLGLPFARDQRLGKGTSSTNELDLEVSAVVEVRL